VTIVKLSSNGEYRHPANAVSFSFDIRSSFNDDNFTVNVTMRERISRIELP
jgi:hypothetical protein